MMFSENRIDITTGWLNVNTGCNNRCEWCYKQGDLEAAPKDMPLHISQQIIDFFVALDICSCIFIGGEPTLYKELTKLIKYAHQGGITELTVVTNGRLLKNRALIDEYVNAGLDVFSISVHSAFQDIHDHISRVSSWEETMKGISNVVDSGCTCSLNLVVGEHNIDYVKKSIPIFLNMGVQKIVVTCALPSIYNGKVDGSNALNPKIFAKLVKELLEFPPEVVIMNELPLCILDKGVFTSLMEQQRLGYGCHVGLGKGLSVDVDGNIIPCNSFANYPLIELFKDEKLKYSANQFRELWQNSSTVVDVRQNVNVMRSSICQDCDLWEMCNCGCPLTWGYFNPQDYINDGLLELGTSNPTSSQHCP